MSLDSATDPLIEALGTVLQLGANAALSSELGEDPVITVYQHPAPLQVVSSLQLPALSISRGRTTYNERPSGNPRATIAVNLTYITPPCPLDSLGLRWPLLHAVWEAMADVLFAGGTDAAPLVDFAALGVVGLSERSVTKQDLFADTGGVVYPAFSASFTIQVDPIVSLDGYARLLDLLGSYRLPQSEEGAELEIVRDLIEIAPQPAPTPEPEPDFPGEDTP
jgi:hypothetical protein